MDCLWGLSSVGELGDGVKSSVIYADLTFLTNLVMDLSLIWVTARLAGVGLAYKRWLAASLIGAIYGTGTIIPELGILYSLPAKLAASVILVWLSLKPANWQEFKKSLAYFYLMSFLAAGAAMAISNLSPQNIFRFHPSWLWLGGGLLCLLVLGFAGQRLFVKRLIPELLRFNVSLNFGGRLCHGIGFLDTGNGLCDPLTRRPVIVVEYGILIECLPNDLNQALKNSGGEEDILTAVSTCSWSNRIRIIPFRSVGRQHGLMVGLRADEVVVHMGEQDLAHQDLVVGVYRDRLSQDNSYSMLIPSALLYSKASS